MQKPPQIKQVQEYLYTQVLEMHQSWTVAWCSVKILLLKLLLLKDQSSVNTYFNMLSGTPVPALNRRNGMREEGIITSNQHKVSTTKAQGKQNIHFQVCISILEITLTEKLLMSVYVLKFYQLKYNKTCAQ